MNELVGPWPGSLVTGDDAQARQLADRLEACAPLAFRVAYGVLRHREDAEDVAQEALAKAFQSFRALRDRDRFEAWLVRITWRRALDRRRAEPRRDRREQAAAEPPGGSHRRGPGLLAGAGGPGVGRGRPAVREAADRRGAGRDR